MAPEFKAQIEDLRQLAQKQRELNDAHLKARRAHWDKAIAQASTPEHVQDLLKELASNPSGW